MMSDNDFIAKVCNYDFKNFINYNNVLGIAKGKKIKNKLLHTKMGSLKGASNGRLGS